MITYRLSKGHISNAIATANCIKLKLLELDERDVILIKRQYVNTITSNTNTTTVPTITTMPKGMKMKCSRNFEGEDELNHNRHMYAGCQKGVTTMS